MKVWWGRVTPRAAQPPPQAACGRTPAPGPTGTPCTALVAWLREQHAKAADAFDKHDEEYDLALTAAYRRVLERLGEKP